MKNSPSLLESEAAECAYATMVWNQVDKISWGYVFDVGTKFSLDRMEFQGVVGYFSSENY